jgi:uncharacterized protein (TIRG00374 family)
LLFKVLALSFLIQIARIMIAYVSALALNINLSLVYFFLFIPLITIILMLPTTVGGIGVSEGAYVYFFSRVGMSTHGAFALAILLRTIFTFLALPGGIIYIKEGLSPKRI